MSVNLILPMVQGSFTTILLILVLRQPKQTLPTRIFSMFLLCISLWGFLIFIMRDTTNLETAVFWERGAITMVFLTGISFCFFAAIYTRFINRFYLVILGVYSLGVIGILPTNLWVKSMWVDLYGNNAVWGPLFYPWIFILYLLIVISLIILNRARLASTSYEERNRLLYFIVGTIFCLIGGLLDVTIYPGSIPANIFFALMTTLAILQYHLFDIRVVIRSSAAYLITGLLVAIPILGLGLLWVYLTQRWGFNFWASTLPTGLLILAVPPLWTRIGNITTQHIRREKYEYLKALEQLSLKKFNVSKLDELCSLLTELADNTLRPKFVYLFIPNENSDFMIASLKGAATETEKMVLYHDHPLIQILKLKRQLIWRQQVNVFPELQAMSIQDREILTLVNADIYYPIGIGELSGILALGPKPPGQVYSREDLEFLGTFLYQVGLGLENIYLFNREKSQRQRVEQFNAERATFLDALAHEMKTPLTSAVSSSDLLVYELRGQTGNLPLLANDVQSSVDNLGRIVNDILDFGRMQQAKVKCEIQDLDINDIILKVKEEIKFTLLRKQQSLELSIPEEQLIVKADIARVKQVLHNIINNASKFSGIGCIIQLNVKPEDRYIRVEIQDCAEIISEEDRGHLFTPYYRGGIAKQKRLPGLGLGLFICKELIEMQNGKIWLDERKGSGNTFCFSLPRVNKNNENINN